MADFTDRHFALLELIQDGMIREVYNPVAVPLIERLAGARMVEWDVSERPIHGTGALGYGRVRILPDGTGALADYRRPRPSVPITPEGECLEASIFPRKPQLRRGSAGLG